MSRRSTFVAATLLVVAGCTGLPAGFGDDAGVTGAHGADPDLDALRTAHEQQLRAAGSFTYEERTVVQTDDEDALVQRTTESHVARVDLETGRAHRRRVTPSDKIIVTYRTAAGDVYERTELSTGKTNYLPPVGGLTAKRYRRPALFDRLANVSVEHRTNGSDHVYRASGVDALDPAARSSVSEGNLTRFSVRGTVTDAGLLRSYEYTFDVRRDGATYTVTRTGQFRALGETTVPEPDWLAAARAARERRQSRPDPTDYVETSTTRDDLGVRFTVYARADSLSDPELRERDHWHTAFLNRSRVAPVVEAYWPQHTANGTLSFRYADGAVPGGNESALRVVRYDRDSQLFVPVETTVDADADVATARIRAQGLYSLFQYRAYRRAFGDRRPSPTAG